jgi:hypothetical protein
MFSSVLRLNIYLKSVPKKIHSEDEVSKTIYFYF